MNPSPLEEVGQRIREHLARGRGVSAGRIRVNISAKHMLDGKRALAIWVTIDGTLLDRAGRRQVEVFVSRLGVCA